MDVDSMNPTNTTTKERTTSPLTTMSMASGSSYGAFLGTRSSHRKRPYQDDDVQREPSSKHVKTEDVETDLLDHTRCTAGQLGSPPAKEAVFIDLTH